MYSVRIDSLIERDMVTPPNKPTVPNTTPDDVVSQQDQQMRETIRASVFDATQAGIYKKIDEEKEEIRSGSARQGDNLLQVIWKMIKSFIFMIAEALNLDKPLAKLMGMPIPEEKEVTAISNQVAQSVSHAMTDKSFTYTTKQEFETKLKDRIAANLTPTEAFNTNRLAEVATIAARNVTVQFSSQFDNEGKVKAQFTNLAPTEAIAAAQFSNALETNLAQMNEAQKSQLTQLAGKEVGKPEIALIATALAPTLSDLTSRKTELQAQGGKAYETVAKEIKTTLIERQTFINSSNMKLDNAAMGILANRIAKEFVGGQLGITANPSEAFQTESQNQERNTAKTKIHETISKAVAANIKTSTAASVLKSYDSAVFSAVLYPKEVKTGKKFYSVDKDGNYQLKQTKESLPITERNQLTKTEDKLHGFAVSYKMSLTDAQITSTAKIVADTVSTTLAEPKNANLDKEAMALLLHNNINSELKKNEQLLNQISPDNKISDINKNNSDAKQTFDIFDTIGKAFADTIRNDDRNFKQIKDAQKMLHTSISTMEIPVALSPNIGKPSHLPETPEGGFRPINGLPNNSVERTV